MLPGRQGQLDQRSRQELTDAATKRSDCPLFLSGCSTNAKSAMEEKIIASAISAAEPGDEGVSEVP